MKDEKIDFIFSSDLARAADTAKEIAKFHPEAQIMFVEQLRERDIGEFTGKKKSDFGWGKEDFKITFLDNDKAETMEQLFNRAENFIKKTIAKHYKNTVLFVGHNGINKALLAAITGKTHKNIDDIENQRNTSLNIIEIDKNRNRKIHLYNNTEHLK